MPIPSNAFDDPCAHPDIQAYAHAAATGNVGAVREYLQNPQNRLKDAAHRQALVQAAKANDLTIVKLILDQTNAKPEVAIKPFGRRSAKTIQRDSVAFVLDNALAKSGVDILMLLLRQEAVQTFLRTVPRDHYIFKSLCTMLAGLKNLRPGAELVYLVSSGNAARLPLFLLTDKPPIDKRERISRRYGLEQFEQVKPGLIERRKSMLYTFRALQKQLPLPSAIVSNIFDMAIADQDWQDEPISKAEILATTSIRPKITG